MGYQLWLADAARREGCRVVEVAGWRTRGSTTFAPRGLVAHHTAGPAAGGDIPSLNVLINGRSDLPGPLCNYGLGRSGTVYVIAAGRASHAGRGGWNGLAGNSSVIGIEAENNGKQPWPQAQLDAYVLLSAAIARALDQPIRNGCGHKEWAPGRKPDPHSLDMDQGRRLVAGRVAHQPRPTSPTVVSPPTKDWFDMATQKDLQSVVSTEFIKAFAELRKTDIPAIRNIVREELTQRDNKWEAPRFRRIRAALNTIAGRNVVPDRDPG